MKKWISLLCIITLLFSVFAAAHGTDAADIQAQIEALQAQLDALSLEETEDSLTVEPTSTSPNTIIPISNGVEMRLGDREEIPDHAAFSVTGLSEAISIRLLYEAAEDSDGAHRYLVVAISLRNDLIESVCVGDLIQEPKLIYDGKHVFHLVESEAIAELILDPLVEQTVYFPFYVPRSILKVTGSTFVFEMSFDKLLYSMPIDVEKHLSLTNYDISEIQNRNPGPTPTPMPNRTATPKPTRTPRPTRTPSPTRTPKPN